MTRSRKNRAAKTKLSNSFLALTAECRRRAVLKIYARNGGYIQFDTHTQNAAKAAISDALVDIHLARRGYQQ